MAKKETLDALYRQHMKALYYYLYKMCGNAQLAEDLVQETFVRATISLNTANENSAKSWLFQVARNAYLDEWRKQERRRNNPLFQLFLKPKKLYSPYGVPEEELLNTHHETILHSLLQQLPEHYRTVYLLREEHQMSYYEMSEMLQLSEQQVKVMLHRARKKLKIIVQKEASDFD